MLKLSFDKHRPSSNLPPTAVFQDLLYSSELRNQLGSIDADVDCRILSQDFFFWMIGYCEDWAARKSAAEALGRLATMERNGLGEFKSKCLKIVESRKYDKVKVVREVMNEMIEAWKDVLG